MFKPNKNTLKSVGNSTKIKAAAAWGGFKRHWLDIITVAGVIFGVVMLIALIFVNVIPVKLADIKVPVATDKSSYYAGQQIGGLFFGETYYDGNVKILREVFCTNYKGVIKPPAEAADGDFFDTIAKPRVLNGNTVPIGTLPADVPTGSNCVIRFTNVYNLKTIFGTRREEYQYYTQNFAIITKERRLQLDCEATGKSTAQCQQELSDGQVTADTNAVTSSDNTFGGGSFGGGGASGGTTNTTTNNVTNNTTNNSTVTPPQQDQPNAPVQPPQECTVNLLFIHLICR